jgi:predicted Zn-dependent peptidase
MNGYSTNPNADMARLLPAVSAQDIVQFHQQHISNNKRVWIIIGDKKLTDMKALARFGKVVQLKKEDVYR